MCIEAIVSQSNVVVVYKTKSVCVFLFLMHGHSSEHIWTKFDVWHPFTVQMVIGWLASAARAHGLVL